MDALDELLHQFGGLSVDNTNDNNECKVNTEEVLTHETTSNKECYQSAPWMKQFKFKHILLPIHDAIFPNQTLTTDELKHQTIFNAIDTNNDGFISQKEFVKATSLSSDQSVIPIQRIYEVFREINSDKNEKGVSFERWMNAVLNIDLKLVQNNEQVTNDGKEDDDDGHLESVHVMTVLKCMHNVWCALGPAHRESAYQKALLFELLDNGYRVLMEKRVPVYHYTKHKKKIHLVSMERIDLYIKYPATVIEMKAVSSKPSVKDEYQTKKYSRNRRYLSFLVNCPNNRDDLEIKCWNIGKDGDFEALDLTQYKV
eukprot:291230_1